MQLLLTYSVRAALYQVASDQEKSRIREALCEQLGSVTENAFGILA